MGEGLLGQFSLVKEQLNRVEGRMTEDEDTEQAMSGNYDSRVGSDNEYENEEDGRPPTERRMSS